MSQDPIGEQGGLNLYGMVNNDPIGSWDYLGLLTVPTMIWAIDKITSPNWKSNSIVMPNFKNLNKDYSPWDYSNGSYIASSNYVNDNVYVKHALYVTKMNAGVTNFTIGSFDSVLLDQKNWWEGMTQSISKLQKRYGGGGRTSEKRSLLWAIWFVPKNKQVVDDVKPWGYLTHDGSLSYHPNGNVWMQTSRSYTLQKKHYLESGKFTPINNAYLFWHGTRSASSFGAVHTSLMTSFLAHNNLVGEKHHGAEIVKPVFVFEQPLCSLKKGKYEFTVVDENPENMVRKKVRGHLATFSLNLIEK